MLDPRDLILYQEDTMRKPEFNDLASRRSAAAEAKASLLHAHRAAVEAAQPDHQKRQEERIATSLARDVRRTERDLANLADRESAQAAAEKVLHAAIKADEQAKADAIEKAANDQLSQVVEDEVVRKAERDRRYAARKAKKR